MMSLKAIAILCGGSIGAVGLRQKNKLDYLLPLFLFMQKHPFMWSYTNAWGRQESAIMQALLPSVLQSPTAIFWQRPNSEKKLQSTETLQKIFLTPFIEKSILFNQIGHEHPTMTKTHSVNDSIKDCGWVFLENPAKNCIVGMLLSCPITIITYYYFSWGLHSLPTSE